MIVHVHRPWAAKYIWSEKINILQIIDFTWDKHHLIIGTRLCYDAVQT